MGRGAKRLPLDDDDDDVGLNITGYQMATFFFFIVALRPRKRDGLLGTGTEGEGDERVEARPRIPPKKDRRDVDRRQNNGSVKAVSLAIAQRLVHCAIALSTAVLGQSHKDNVSCTAVDEQLGQLEAKEVQPAQPSSTSLLMITSGLTWRSRFHLPPLRSLDLLISPGTLMATCSTFLFINANQ